MVSLCRVRENTGFILFVAHAVAFKCAWIRLLHCAFESFSEEQHWDFLENLFWMLSWLFSILDFALQKIEILTNV